MKISFVTTIYKSAGAIPEFIDRATMAAATLGFDYEIVFINDASPDNGLDVARQAAQQNPKIVVVDLSRNFGQHRALWTGLTYASGDLVMILDGDLEEDPMWALPFYKAMQTNGSDVVFGIQAKPKGSYGYRVGRNTFYRALDALTTFEFPRDSTTARVMTRRYVEALKQFTERELFLVGVMHVAGFSQVGVKVEKLALSETTYNFRKLFWLFLNAVTAFSVSPLIIIFLSGIFICILSFLAIAFIVLSKLFVGVGVEGWVSVMAAVSLSLGLNLLVNGIIAIYLATIFLEVKRRPLSIVKDVFRSDEKP